MDSYAAGRPTILSEVNERGVLYGGLTQGDPAKRP